MFFWLSGLYQKSKIIHLFHSGLIRQLAEEYRNLIKNSLLDDFGITAGMTQNRTFDTAP